MKARIQVISEKKSLPVIRKFVKSRLVALGISERVSNQIVLAVDEACANSIIHQHNCDGVSQIEIFVYMKKTKIHVEIKDTGKAYPINQHKPEDITELIKKRKQGGLGIALIHKIMDDIDVVQYKDYFIYKFAKNI